MRTKKKYDLILDSFQELLEKKNIDSISVSEIAQKAGIAKGGIYYYFKSKDEILYALIERKYQATIETVQLLAEEKDEALFLRLSKMFEACKNARADFIMINDTDGAQLALLHQKYMQYLIKTLKPFLSTILSDAIENGELNFDNPEALAEIVLLVLTVKLDNTISPATSEEVSNTLQGLISLVGHLTDAPNDLLNFLLQ